MYQTSGLQHHYRFFYSTISSNYVLQPTMNRTSLEEFLKSEQAHNPALNPALCLLLQQIALACIHIANAIEKGALTDSMGSLGSENVQGEVQKALDVITNTIFINQLWKSSQVAGLVSEEIPEPMAAPKPLSPENTQYLVAFDPLDGSSNVNVNISVGTIFSVLPWQGQHKAPQKSDYLQPGTQQIAAGYALYGTSTMLMITTGSGVNGFTLDRENQCFVLTHPQLQIPAETAEFAINASNRRFWEPPVQRYIEECIQGKSGPRGRDFNMRWVASMVAEIHRILMRGGVFLYPIDSKIAAQGGKLRLLYEANPMSMIIEQAGGASSTGRQRILTSEPTDIHQRVPVILGSRDEVNRIVAYHLDEA
jgi:fructose-1,6-bisphosphatase I